MPTLRLVDGLPLIVGGALATADDCCCGCPCPNTLPLGWQDGEFACTAAIYVCIEFQYVGDECAVPVNSPDYGAGPAVFYWPCVGEQPYLGISSAANLCAGGVSDQYQIKGRWSCETVEYDEDCNCAASDCDWVDIVAEWRNVGGLQCDCAMELVSYSLNPSNTPCP